MKIVIIGAGNGGVSAAAEMVLQGHEVTLYGRSPASIAPYGEGIAYEGALGQGTVHLAHTTADLAQAIANAQAAIVALPTFALRDVAQRLSRAGWGQTRPVVLNPGHTGGSLEFAAAWRETGQQTPPLAEFSTLAYVARKQEGKRISITSRAPRLRAAALPGGDEALALACQLFTGAYDCGDVLATGLANVNMVLHPPGAILSATWVEARQGDYTFYVEGMTQGVDRVMQQLDAERRAVARAFGHELPSLIAEMKDLGTVSADADETRYADAVASGEANRLIRGPDSFAHRYYTEDFNFGLTPFLAFADIAGVDTPVARALGTLGDCLIAPGPRRDAQAMGIAGFSQSRLLQQIRG